MNKKSAIVVLLVVGVFFSTLLFKVEGKNMEANIFSSMKEFFQDFSLRDIFSSSDRRSNPWNMSNEEIENLPLPESGILHTFDVPVRYDTSVRPKDGEVFFDPPIIPYTGSTPLWYQQTTGDERDAWGYPRQTTEFDKIIAQKNGGKVSLYSEKKHNPFVSEALAYEEDDTIPGLVHCRVGENQTGYFKAWFEDVAAGNGQNFDDAEFGLARRSEACQVLEDVAELVRLGETSTTPNILFPIEQYSDLPGFVLGAASAFYYPYVEHPDNGSLYQHILSGENPQFGYFADTFPQDQQFAYFDARIFINFSDFEWDSDGGVLTDENFDLYSVLLHEVLHTLSFASRPQQNLNESYGGETTPFNTFFTKLFFQNENQEQFPFIDSLGILSQYIEQSSDSNNLVEYHPDEIISELHFPVYSPEAWSSGSSLSHLDEARTEGFFGVSQEYVMHPSLGSGQENTEVHEHEKTILCDMGYAVSGLGDECSISAPFANIDHNESYPVDADTICINPLENDSVYVGDDLLSLSTVSLVVNTNGNVELSYFGEDDCMGEPSASPEGARSVQFMYSDLQSPSDFLYTRLLYQNQSEQTGRLSNFASIIVSNCGYGTYGPGFFDRICNGSFEVTRNPNGEDSGVLVSEGAVIGWEDVGWHGDDIDSKTYVAWNSYEEFLDEEEISYEPCTFDAPCNHLTEHMPEGVSPYHGDKFIFVKESIISDDTNAISFPVLRSKFKESPSYISYSRRIRAILMPNDQDALTQNFEHHISKFFSSEALSASDFLDGVSFYEALNPPDEGYWNSNFVVTNSDSEDYVDVCILNDDCQAEEGIWNLAHISWTQDGWDNAEYAYIVPTDFNRFDDELDGYSSFGVDAIDFMLFTNSPYLPNPGGGGFTPDNFGLVGQVFFDQNQNGVREFGEQLLPNRMLNLYSENNGVYQYQENTTTALGGYYGFNVSNTNPVAILLELNEGEVITTPGVQDFTVETEDRFHSLVPIPNIQQLGLDFGIYYGDTEEPTLGCLDVFALNYNPDATEDDGSCLYTSQISGRVYYDENLSASYDNQEDPVSVSYVALYNELDINTPISTASPDEEGLYSFLIDEVGTYYVVYHIMDDSVFTEPEESNTTIDEISELYEIFSTLSFGELFEDKNFGIIKEDVLTNGTDIGIEKIISSPQTTSADTSIEYTVTITNYGPNNAESIVMSDILPPGVSYQSSYATVPGAVYNSVSGLLYLNSILNVGESVSIVFLVEIKKDACGEITNTASLVSFLGVDTNASNNEDEVSFFLKPCKKPIIKPPLEDIQDVEKDISSTKGWKNTLVEWVRTYQKSLEDTFELFSAR